MTDLQYITPETWVQFNPSKISNSSLALSSARVKLWKRHLWECDAMVVTHKKVLALVREEYILKIFLSSTDRMACVLLKNERSNRLVKVMTRHLEEHLQLKERHQQEKDLLEQASETH